jgi:hypothetical protein
VGHGALRRPVPRSSGAHLSGILTQPVNLPRVHVHAFRPLERGRALPQRGKAYLPLFETVVYRQHQRLWWPHLFLITRT